MRAFIALVFLSGCATLFEEPPPQRVAGCWIERTGSAAVTMRWLPSAERPGFLRGDWLRYENTSAATEAQTYTLEARGEDWALCRAGEPATCWGVAAGRGGSLEGGRAFIDQYGERLRISVIDGSGESEVFDGVRDGCD
jgi:hypothetical protein